MYCDSVAQDMVEYALLAGSVAVTIGGTFPMTGRPMLKIVNRLLAILTTATGITQQVSC